MWLSKEGQGFPGHIHIVPKDDTREHVLNPGCWCRVRPHSDPMQEAYMVHTAADGRKPYEDGDEIEYA